MKTKEVETGKKTFMKDWTACRCRGFDASGNSSSFKVARPKLLVQTPDLLRSRKWNFTPSLSPHFIRENNDENCTG